MKLNKDKILALIEEGYLMANDHPNLPLRIYNYTRKTQFERAWNEYTLMARGLILDFDYEVVAMPFPKFFNYEEHKLEELPIDEFDIFDKMDGSLGIMFFYGLNWHIATRGSFMSDQAIRAKEILKKYNIQNLDEYYTYLFEIIYPENRIVVNYGDEEKLVLLGMIQFNMGTIMDKSYDFMILHKTITGHNFPLVKKYDAVNDIKELKARNVLNEEGYVLRYKKNGLRVKVKFEDYCRLHSIITNISTKDIWQCLRDGKDIDELLDRTPDEFDEWVRDQVKGLKENFYAQEWSAKDIYKSIRPFASNKKEFAEYALKFSCSAMLFKMYEGKPYDNIVWKMIEPKWSKPFFKQDDEE